MAASGVTITKATVDYVRNAMNSGKRLDGRKNSEYRKIEITKDVSCWAEGHARVKVGETEVICGIKFAIGKPYPDSPDEGSMTTSVEFPPLGDPEYEAGLPKPPHVEISRVVDRAIRETKAIDFKKLCIEEGNACYMMFIDMTVLNNDGNVLDAAGIAGAAALQGCKLPKADKDEEGNYKINYDEHVGDLVTTTIPLSITVRKTANGEMFVDPSLAEEEAFHGRITVGTKTNGNISSLQMAGNDSFTPEETAKAFALAVEASDKIRKENFQ